MRTSSLIYVNVARCQIVNTSEHPLCPDWSLEHWQKLCLGNNTLLCQNKNFGMLALCESDKKEIMSILWVVVILIFCLDIYEDMCKGSRYTFPTHKREFPSLLVNTTRNGVNIRHILGNISKEKLWSVCEFTVSIKIKSILVKFQGYNILYVALPTLA